MGQLVVMGAMMTCSFGAAPSSLMVLPTHRTMGCNVPAANINDHTPFLNILPFGVCSSPMQPSMKPIPPKPPVPGPCVPAVSSPWIVGAVTVMLDNMPALNSTSINMCSAFGGVISIAFAGQITVQVP